MATKTNSTIASAASHNRTVATVQRRTDRRSRSITRRVSSRTSGSTGKPPSSCNSALASSFSLMHRPLLDDSPKRLLRVVEPRPHGADRGADDPGDVVVAHPLQEPQHDHLALLRRQP